MLTPVILTTALLNTSKFVPELQTVRQRGELLAQVFLSAERQSWGPNPWSWLQAPPDMALLDPGQ